MNWLLLSLSCATLAFSAAALNSTQVLGEVRNILEKIEETPDKIFEIEQALVKRNEGDRALASDAAKLAQNIREELIDFPPKVYKRLFDLELELSELDMDDDSKEEDEEPCGAWNLGMNLNPNDGHIMGYDEGWAGDSDIGDEDNALLKDYLNQTVWKMPVKYIAIVRHQRGLLDAVKVFLFKNPDQSLSQKFKNMDPGRDIVTVGGPIFAYTAPGVHNLADDPIFGVGGDLAFNWGYSDNGHRIVLTGGYLSPVGVNDDNTHGLGNHFAINPKTNNPATPIWAHEISNIQDCPLATCRTVRIQGTDHGTGPHLKSGPVYGNYAIYVSTDLKTFATSGFLGTTVDGEC